MPKLWIFKWYWIPTFCEFFIGVLLSPLIMTTAAYICTYSQYWQKVSIILGSILGFFALVHIVNWIFEYKLIFKIDNVKYEFSKKNSHMKHPFWKPIKWVTNIFIGIGTINPAADVEIEELKREMWDDIDIGLFTLFLEYKEAKNIKILYWSCWFYPSFLGFSLSSLISVGFLLLGSYLISIIPLYISVPIITISVPGLILSGIYYVNMSNWMSEIAINRAVDLDDKTKLEYYRSVYSTKSKPTEYLETIRSKKFWDYVRNRNK
ncbi:hypothetical protein [Mycoplasma seminis]|uniref:Uncharacterized protein n=1 Tax=Mycoplasma seminis TaxID=512749 RepID=A0ABY9HAF1_9MOLU|nr:hypothetical protein [Mycoplasma seminis]WLP85303.1 hypothetical protein Q8852_03195 [Mycoplasma seminis]